MNALFEQKSCLSVALEGTPGTFETPGTTTASWIEGFDLKVNRSAEAKRATIYQGSLINQNRVYSGLKTIDFSFSTYFPIEDDYETGSIEKLLNGTMLCANQVSTDTVIFELANDETKSLSFYLIESGTNRLSVKGCRGSFVMKVIAGERVTFDWIFRGILAGSGSCITPAPNYYGDKYLYGKCNTDPSISNEYVESWEYDMGGDIQNLTAVSACDNGVQEIYIAGFDPKIKIKTVPTSYLALDAGLVGDSFAVTLETNGSVKPYMSITDSNGAGINGTVESREAATENGIYKIDRTLAGTDATQLRMVFSSSV